MFCVNRRLDPSLDLIRCLLLEFGCYPVCKSLIFHHRISRFFTPSRRKRLKKKKKMKKMDCSLIEVEVKAKGVISQYKQRFKKRSEQRKSRVDNRSRGLKLQLNRKKGIFVAAVESSLEESVQTCSPGIISFLFPYSFLQEDILYVFLCCIQSPLWRL